MTILGKKQMSEEDIKLNYITPVVQKGWRGHITMETKITDGRINIRGNIVARSKPKFADYILYLNDGKPIAVVEAKDNNHTVSHGLQQAMTYAQMMDLPFAYSSNGAAVKGALTEQLETDSVVTIPPVPDDVEVPYDIPSTWKWAYLKNACVYLQRGKSPKYSPVEQIPVIAQKCNQWSGFQLEKAQFIEPSTLSAYTKERILQDGDIMINSTGLGTLGRIAIYPADKNPYGIAVADSHVTVVRLNRNIMLPEFSICTGQTQAFNS